MLEFPLVCSTCFTQRISARVYQVHDLFHVVVRCSVAARSWNHAAKDMLGHVVIEVVIGRRSSLPLVLANGHAVAQ